MPYAAGPYPAAAHPAAPHATGPYPTAPYPTAPYPTAPYPTAQYPDAQYPGAQYPGAQYPAGPYPGAPYPQGPHPQSHPGPFPQYAHPQGQQPPGSTPAPPARTHRWGLGAYLLVEAVFILASGLVGLAVSGDGPPSAGTLALALAVPTVLAAGTALLITRLRGNGPRIDLGLQWSARDLGIGLAFGFGGLVLTIPASILYVAVVGEDATSAVGNVFGEVRATPLMAVVVFLIVVLLAPLCEEIVYRGLLWGGVERLGGRWVAFGVTTLLFALAHFEFTRTPLLLVVAIPIAAARLYTGRLLASIVAHQVNNLLPGVALLLGLLGVLPMS